MASARLLFAVAILVATAGCHGKGAPAAEGATGPGKVAPAKSEAAQAPDGPTTETGTSTVKPAPPLTQEEKDLIAADPATLTPDQRRARAYALRKKIMQNPNSPTARELRRVGDALKRGEIDVGQIGIRKKRESDSTRAGADSTAAPPAGKSLQK